MPRGERKARPSRLYTNVPILTPGDEEMLAVFSDGFVASLPYHYDGVKSVGEGTLQLEKEHGRHGEIVRLICNRGVREDWMSKLVQR
jgi:hypothetical protein